MPTASVAINIGALITTHPGIHNGCPIVAGTGVTVRLYEVRSLNYQQLCNPVNNLSF